MNIQGLRGDYSNYFKSSSEKTNQQSIKVNLTNKKNDYLSLMEKQKEELIKEKEALSEKDLSAEEKKFKMEELNKQLAEIEARIQEVKAREVEKQNEKMREKLEEKKAKDPQNTDRVEGGVIVSKSLEKLIETNQRMNNISNLKVTKATMEVERGWLTLNEDSNSFVNKQYAKLTSGINGLENKIKSEISDIANKNHIVEETKEIDEANETNKENEISEKEKNNTDTLEKREE